MPSTMLVDLALRLDEPAILLLLAYSVGYPTPEKLQAIAARYRTDAAWRLLGVDGDGKCGIAGCIGVELHPDATAVIRHIAVAPSCRGRGIGRAMIEAACARFQLRGISAETDADAVGFYQRCGFSITNLGERYPGTERFLCVKNMDVLVNE